jgi:hypothetical protein
LRYLLTALGEAQVLMVEYSDEIANAEVERLKGKANR